MKRIISTILALLLFLSMSTVVFADDTTKSESAMNLSFNSTTYEQNNAYDGIARFPQKQVNLISEKKIQLQALAYNKQGKKVKLTYKSSNTTVATVNKSNGTITAKKNGTAKITATGKGVKKATLTVKVVSKSTKLTSVKVSNWNGTQEIHIGQSRTINAAPVPSNATSARIKYKSSNTNVARVTASGTVTAVGTGEANITVSCGTASKNLSLKAGRSPSRIDKTVYNANGVTITADTIQYPMGGVWGLAYGSGNTHMWFTVTNNSAQSVRCWLRNVKVNGVNVTPTLSYIPPLNPNSTGSGDVIFFPGEWKNTGIQDAAVIKTISYTFEIAKILESHGQPSDFSDTITINL